MSDFKAKMHKIRFPLGLRPRPRSGSLQRSPHPAAVFKWPTSEGGSGRGEVNGVARPRIFSPKTAPGSLYAGGSFLTEGENFTRSETSLLSHSTRIIQQRCRQLLSYTEVVIHALTDKKLSCRRGTARCVVSIEILPIATQQCRNYLYDKS